MTGSQLVISIKDMSVNTVSCIQKELKSPGIEEESLDLYRLEKLVTISKFLDSYCSRIMGGGQDNPAGLSSSPGEGGGQDKPAGICCPLWG